MQTTHPDSKTDQYGEKDEIKLSEVVVQGDDTNVGLAAYEESKLLGEIVSQLLLYSVSG